MSNVASFPSPKRVHGLPYHSHNHTYSDPNNKPTASHSDSGPPHYKSRNRADHHRHERPNAKAKEAPPSSSASVLTRVSNKLPTAFIPQHRKQNKQDIQVSHIEIDIDQEDAVDGSSDEGCVVVDVSQRFIVADPPSSAKEKLVESDPHRLSQRQKQIDYGKNTLGYERYTELVPRNKRKKFVHPRTPDIKQVCSKRSWDGQVRKWRTQLHEFDLPASENEETPKLFSIGGGSAAHSQDKDDATTSSGSEGSTEKEVEVSAIFDDWDDDDDVLPAHYRY